MEIKTQTSQQAAGEHSRPEGDKQGGGLTSYAPSASVPGEVTQPVKGEIMKIDTSETSQQKRGEHKKLDSNY